MATERIVIEIDVDNKDLDSTLKKLEKFGKVDKKNSESFKQSAESFKKGAKKADESVTQLSKGLGKLKTVIVGAFAVQALVNFGKAAVKTLTEFETALAGLSAITGATGEDLDFLSQKAIQLSLASTKSAKDVVEAFKLIGSAKPELLQNSAALADLTEQAIILSEAAGLDLPVAAEQLGSALNALNLPASEAARVINVLAAASQKGTREIPFLNDALAKFGGIAAQAGVSIEESAAAVEILGKVIPESATVGVNLRNILTILQVEAQKSGREFKGLTGELELLGPEVNNIALLEKKFGRENLLAIQTLIAEKDAVVNLQAAITGTSTALEQQAIRTQTTAAQAEKLSNTWDNFVLSLSDSTGALSTVIGFLNDFLNHIIDLNKSLDQLRSESFSEALAQNIKDDAKEVDDFAEKIKGSFDTIAQARARAAQIILESLEKVRDSEREFTESELKSINERIKALKKITTIEVESIEEVTKAKKLSEKELEKLAKERIKREQSEIKNTLDASKTELRLFREEEKRKQDGFDFDQKLKDKERAAKEKELAQDDKDREDQKKKDDDAKRAAIDGAIQAAIQVGNAIAEITKNQSEKRIQEADALQNAQQDKLDEQLANNLITEEEFEKKSLENKEKFQRIEAEEKTKQAKIDKAAAIVSSIINTAVEVTKQLANVPLAIAIGIAGAAQTAAIASQPIPTFFEGTEWLDRDGNPIGRDTIPVMAHEGERIVPTSVNRKMKGIKNADLPKIVDFYNTYSNPNYEADLAREVSNTFGITATLEDGKKLYKEMKRANRLAEESIYWIKESQKARHTYNG